MPAPPLSDVTVIIPTLDEAAGIHATIEAVRVQLPGTTIVVADGGSRDGTKAIAAAMGARVLESERGRGKQCRAGAALAKTEWLLFLHADTLLPENAGGVVQHFVVCPAAQIATFRLRFDRPGLFLAACCWFTRIDSVFTRFGDQGILVRRSFYEELGGFPPWPLFEDVALLQRARTRTRVHSLPTAVTTSARRFQARGHFRQQFLNARLLLRYLAGTAPEVLAGEYRAAARKSRPVSAALPCAQEPTPRA